MSFQSNTTQGENIVDWEVDSFLNTPKEDLFALPSYGDKDLHRFY